MFQDPEKKREHVLVTEESNPITYVPPVEASGGNPQTYIDSHNQSINLSLHLKWCLQAAEAIQCIHQKRVIHFGLQPENYLLHTDSTGILSLFLCGLGGSTSGTIDGGPLSDSGFFNPSKRWVS